MQTIFCADYQQYASLCFFVWVFPCSLSASLLQLYLTHRLDMMRVIRETKH